jgi:hypothetical protein
MMRSMANPAAALPADLKLKLAPLLRIQASDNDGERANASAAINRLLKKYGLDWHDLTAVLLSNSPPQQQQSAWKRSSGPIDLPRKDLIELLDMVEQHTPSLSPKTVGFITTLRSRAYYSTVFLTEKQWKWLQDLVEATGA